MSAVLIIGGYGGFGARLSRRLAAGGHEVLVAGRRLAEAERFCSTLERCRPVEVDRRGDLRPVLRQLKPHLVIDAAGPFQGSGFGVPEVCIETGISYLDLADGREFVTGIARLDDRARAAGVTVLSRASSVPALSGAVVRHLAAGLDRVTAIEMAIGASNRATAGPSVAAAILGTVGRPLRLWRGGRWQTGFGWQELRRESIAVPGGASLDPRWLALVDVPDLDLLPARMQGRPAVTFRAGTELSIQMAALWLASWTVRWGWLHSLGGWARWLLPLQRLTDRWGSDRSGMVVGLFGTRGERRLERRWTLIAGDGHGPEIPTLAAALLAERILTGQVPSGARDAGEALELDNFAPAFASLSIQQGTAEIAQSDPLYRRIMADRFDALPPAVKALHSVLRDGGASGRATVTRGRHTLARLVAAVMRFPVAGYHDLNVSFEECDGVERWTRNFSGRRFSSHLSRQGRQLVERFGPLRFRFDLPSDRRGLRMEMRGWSGLGVPLPLALAPRSQAREWAEDGAFRFDVPIALPFIGLVVCYRGWLSPIAHGSAS